MHTQHSTMHHHHYRSICTVVATTIGKTIIILSLLFLFLLFLLFLGFESSYNNNGQVITFYDTRRRIVGQQEQGQHQQQHNRQQQGIQQFQPIDDVEHSFQYLRFMDWVQRFRSRPYQPGQPPFPVPSQSQQQPQQPHNTGPKPIYDEPTPTTTSTTTPIVKAPQQQPTPTPTDDSVSYYCACSKCTKQIWEQATDGGFTCGERITWVQYNDPIASGDVIIACQIVSEQFPNLCGPYCHPTLCHDDTTPTTTTTLSPVMSPTSSSTPTDDDLYCFPPYSTTSSSNNGGGVLSGTTPDIVSRLQYTNAWDGKYTIEVKENGMQVCDPSSNLFSRETVSWMNETNELLLQFKQVQQVQQQEQKNNSDNNNNNNPMVWTASEIRILPPTNEIFSYGTYEYTVQSIRVYHETTGVTIRTFLPPSLVLGFFTWDPTEDYNTRHEHYNHEVDIELSRWKNRNGPDGLFLVQPSGSHGYRFYTGGSINNNTSTSTTTTTRYQPSPRRYGFTWLPGNITWYMILPTTDDDDNNNNEKEEKEERLSYMYSTADTVKRNNTAQPTQKVEDYIQCLPSKALEIRMNLWNLGGTTTPERINDNNDNDNNNNNNNDEIVEVIISNFSYQPSSETFLPDNSICSKDCQCNMPFSTCQNHLCTPQQQS